MGRIRPILIAGIILLLSPPLPAQADVDEAFRLAENTFQYQDYAKAVELLKALFEPPMKLKKGSVQLRTAREYLGAAYWFLGNREEAEESFTRLLLNYEEHRLDPLFYPPNLVQFFDGIIQKLQRLDLIGGTTTKKEDPDLNKTSDKGDKIRVRHEIIEHRPFATVFVPFGGGQFFNGDKIGGALFLISEVLALATAVTSYYMILDTAPVDTVLAEKWEVAFWVSQGLFFGLAITGMLEAGLRFEGDRTRVEEFDEFINENEEKDNPDAESSRSPVPQVGVLPGGGIMIGIGHRF